MAIDCGLDPAEPLEDELEAVPQSDHDEVKEDPSEGSTPVEYSDADVWEYDPEEIPVATSKFLNRGVTRYADDAGFYLTTPQSIPFEEDDADDDASGFHLRPRTSKCPVAPQNVILEDLSSDVETTIAVLVAYASPSAVGESSHQCVDPPSTALVDVATQSIEPQVPAQEFQDEALLDTQVEMP
ncbi:hypothetical protein RIF29_20370 [Crotalaria pallida]|uniref:Uncharacterized protein n=1 Tax=Crotalaria pallida TaxID=3830 RepID=A0AAN9F0Z5_CROPI